MSQTAVLEHEAHDPHATNTGISNEKLGMWLFLGSECLMFGGLISTYLLYKNRAGSAASGYASPLRPNEFFDIPFTSLSSFILLASSLTMVFAVSSAARHDQAKMRIWLATTAALGAMFVGGQVYEFTTFVKEGREVRSEVMEKRDEWKADPASAKPFELDLPNGQRMVVTYAGGDEVSVDVEHGASNVMDPAKIGVGFSSSTSSSAFFTMTGFHGFHVTVGIIILMMVLGLSLRRRLPDSKAEAVEIAGLYWHFVDIVWIVIFTVVYLIK